MGRTADRRAADQAILVAALQRHSAGPALRASDLKNLTGVPKCYVQCTLTDVPGVVKVKSQGAFWYWWQA
jgi:hypothetical protein